MQHNAIIAQRYKSAKMQRCKDAKVQRHKGTKAQRCNIALYNSFMPHNYLVLLNGVAQINGTVLLYGIAWPLTTARC